VAILLGGPFYGLLAASLVLVMLLLENSALYAKLAASHERERRKRRLVQEKSVELAQLNKELGAFSYSVSHDLRAEQVTIEDLVNRVIAEQRMTYAHRAVEFTVGELGSARADPALLKQALANLIGNAVKYTRGRYPARVEIGVRPAEAPGGAPVFYVKDNGVGFDMRQSHRLFGIFQRFHSPQEFEGTGVGLAIVKRIVVRHGGRIWAESRPNEGAVFYFTLERDRSEEATQQSAAA